MHPWWIYYRKCTIWVRSLKKCGILTINYHLCIPCTKTTIPMSTLLCQVYRCFALGLIACMSISVGSLCLTCTAEHGVCDWQLVCRYIVHVLLCVSYVLHIDMLMSLTKALKWNLYTCMNNDEHNFEDTVNSFNV